MSETNDKRLFLIDAYAMIFRGYYALIRSPRITSTGIDTSAIFGFTNSLIELIRREKPTHLAVVFDVGQASVRTADFADYKANRSETPEAIKLAIPYIHRILEAMHVPILGLEGYEADDIIGSLSKKYKDEYKVIIVSPDKDLAQLINEDVVLFKRVRTKTTKGYKTISHINIFEEYGVKAEQIPDWLALMGDVADNLPGLDKVGEKTAAKILAQYPTLEHLLSIIHEHKDIKFKEKVMQNKDSLLLVKKLATIECDLPLDNSINDSIQLSNNIRNDADYHKKLIKIKNHFNWPLNFIDMFL